MTLTLDVSPEVKNRLQVVAAERGIAPEQYALQILEERMVAELPNGADTGGNLGQAGAGEQDPTLALFARWKAEDATDDPEELARRQADWETFRDHVNATRAAAGARLLYP
jgi:hypothetical protein